MESQVSKGIGGVARLHYGSGLACRIDFMTQEDAVASLHKTVSAEASIILARTFSDASNQIPIPWGS
jgi:hypothetical protein